MLRARVFANMAAAAGLLHDHAGGFDPDFVEPLAERLTCPICYLALREPYLTRCGHQFCYGCLRPLIGNGTCPVCRADIKETETFPNNMVKREIMCLKIKCERQEDGCEWIGELKQQDEHKALCGYETVHCDNNCDEMMMRKDKEHHKENLCPRRIVSCSYCDLQLENQELSVHFKSCVQYPVACKYGCGMQIARGHVDTHISREGNCSMSPLQCDFIDAGCTFSGNRCQLEEHLVKGTVGHLNLMMKSFHMTTEKLVASNKRQEKLANELAVTKAMLEARQDELAKELATTKQVLAKTESELESVKIWETLVTKSPQALDLLLKDGPEKSLESSKFMRLLLVDKQQTSIMMSETSYFIWKLPKPPFRHCTLKYTTRGPGWRFTINCHFETDKLRMETSDALTIGTIKVAVYPSREFFTHHFLPKPMTLSISLMNKQSSNNIVQTCDTNRSVKAKFQVEFDWVSDSITEQQFVENDEILFQLQLKPR